MLSFGPVSVTQLSSMQVTSYNIFFLLRIIQNNWIIHRGDDDRFQSRAGPCGNVESILFGTLVSCAQVVVAFVWLCDHCHIHSNHHYPYQLQCQRHYHDHHHHHNHHHRHRRRCRRRRAVVMIIISN